MDHSELLSVIEGALDDAPVTSGSAYRSRARILVADHQEPIRSAVAGLLERRGYELVGLAASGAEAVDLWRQLEPDVTLLELHLPGQDGIATTEAIRAIDANARIVLLSNFDSDEPVNRAFRAGASGYLLKSASADVLCKSINVVHAGGRFLTPELAQRLATRAGPPVPTRGEIEVLSGVAQDLCNKGIGRARIGRIVGIHLHHQSRRT